MSSRFFSVPLHYEQESLLFPRPAVHVYHVVVLLVIQLRDTYHIVLCNAWPAVWIEHDIVGLFVHPERQVLSVPDS